MKKYFLSLFALSFFSITFQLLAISADLDGDGKKETVEYNNKLLIVKDDDGKILMMEKVEVDLTPQKAIPMTQLGVYWQILKWPMLDIVIIYTQSIGASGKFSDIYTVSWGPREKPGLVKLAITNIAETIINIDDIDHDGADEIIAKCDCLMNPNNFEAALVGNNYSDIQSRLSEAEQQWFSYVIDFAPSTLFPYVWKFPQISKNNELFNEWLDKCFEVAKRLQKSGHADSRQRVQTLVLDLCKDRIPVSYYFKEIPKLPIASRIERILKIKGIGIFDSYIRSSPFKFIASSGNYEAKYFVIDGSNISTIAIVDHLNYYKWKSGDKYSSIIKSKENLGDSFSFEIAKEDTYHIILSNTKSYVKRVYFQLENSK